MLKLENFKQNTLKLQNLKSRTIQFSQLKAEMYLNLKVKNKISNIFGKLKDIKIKKPSLPGIKISKNFIR